MMNLADPSMWMLAASGGDTVKLFDVSREPGDPCISSYTPSPGCLVNTVKWNHTNLVVASAGEDKKISLWRKNGQSMGTIPVAGTDTGDNIEISWLKQHSAPTAGISFSPSNDKIIASIGLDKKLYTYDLESRRPSSYISYEAPFSSLAFRDDGLTLAAGTSSGRVVFYDVRGRPQPFTVLRAYGSSEAVTSLCWQRSKPVVVNESTCTAETALLGSAVEDSILMPDPLPTVTASSVSLSTGVSNSHNLGRSGLSVEASSLASTSSGSASSMPSFAEETPHRSHLWPSGTLTSLHAPRTSYNFKDDMEVFSPLVDVHPITSALNKLWDDHEGTRKGNLSIDKKPSSLLFPSAGSRFPFADDVTNDHPIFDWKTSSTFKQEETRSSFSPLESTPTPSSKSEESSITPPEAWGGERLSEKLTHLHQSLSLPSQFGMLTSGGFPDLPSTSQIIMSSLTNSNMSFSSLHPRDVSSKQENSTGFSELVSSSSMSQSLSTRSIMGQTTLDVPGSGSLTLPRRFSTYAERISTASSFSNEISLLVSSPKTKKTGAETREELLSSLLSRSDTLSVTEQGILPAVNGGTSQPNKALQLDQQQGNSFTLQLFQRTLEGTLDSFQKSIHEDMRNLHIEILRQFHMQEMEFSSVMSSIAKNQAELIKEIKSLQKENQDLRQLL
ncbi:hypothetical protein MANES_07G121400v8 [Manihot esculenta]|uniref:Uncharacterized protein n=2 Tax=Manihot esculenta TaxID=3983 RepID=A0ACB7HKL8_MANES|nr:hypothetical protein MANES_07G121400v8 [Manihot esculenta]KAG8651386.1 hypothetical protein MANES_07G121400v8 [Manihot esculenta]